MSEKRKRAVESFGHFFFPKRLLRHSFSGQVLKYLRHTCAEGIIEKLGVMIVSRNYEQTWRFSHIVTYR